MGDKKMPGVAADDIGSFAFEIFKGGSEYIGKTVGLAGEHLTISQMAQKLSAALGEEVVYNPVSPEAYRGFGFPGAEDLGNMFQFKHDFESVFCGARDLEKARSIYSSLKTFDQWLSENKNKIPLE